MSYIYMEHPFLMFLDHTQRRTTVSRTPLDEWSARRRDLYLTTHDTHNRQISMPPMGFEPKISAGERPQAQVEVSVTSWSLIQRSPTDCGAPLCDLGTSRMGAPYIYIYIHIYIYNISSLRVNDLTLILLTWRKWWAPNKASKQQTGFNSAFKGLRSWQ